MVVATSSPNRRDLAIVPNQPRHNNPHQSIYGPLLPEVPGWVVTLIRTKQPSLVLVPNVDEDVVLWPYLGLSCDKYSEPDPRTGNRPTQTHGPWFLLNSMLSALSVLSLGIQASTHSHIDTYTPTPATRKSTGPTGPVQVGANLVNEKMRMCQPSSCSFESNTLAPQAHCNPFHSHRLSTWQFPPT